LELGETAPARPTTAAGKISGTARFNKHRRSNNKGKDIPTIRHPPPHFSARHPQTITPLSLLFKLSQKKSHNPCNKIRKKLNAQ
jgi:hypothetical protein